MNMDEQNRKEIEYIRSLLFDVSIPDVIPKDLARISGMEEVDDTIRSLRFAVNEIGMGELSSRIAGHGYLIGALKNLQAALKSLTWQTKAISGGDFLQRVDFLGEFSEAFNNMVEKLDSAIVEVKEAKELFELFFDTIPDATLILSCESTTLFKWNKAFEEITGYDQDDLTDKTLDQIRLFADDSQRDLFFDSIAQDRYANNVIIQFKVRDGIEIQGLVSSRIITIGTDKFILSVIRDITELNQMEERLKESEERHRLIADNASDVIWTMDLTGRFSYVSPSVYKLRGYTQEEVMKQSLEELICPSSIEYFERGLKVAVHCVQNHLPFKVFRGDVEQPHKNGSTVWTDVTVSGIYDKENRFVGMLGVTRDITDRKRMEEEIRRLSETDRLTMLNNRLKLDEVMNQELKKASENEADCSLILMDIDHFKKVNDSFGHLVGDTVLQKMAEILTKTVRKHDTIGRWGGEEFLIILPYTDVDVAKNVAERIRLEIEHHDFEGVGNITASFGVAGAYGDKNRLSIVSRVDTALYKAKNNGRNQVSVYQDDF